MPSYPGLVPFIVHGHDHAFRDSVVNHLQNSLGMTNPVVLDLVANAGRTVIEKFEDESAKCNLAIVLLTPDDHATTGTGTPYDTARPNVWLELGYFMAWFGRRSGRTILIYKKGLDIPSDLVGIVYIDATSGISDPNVSMRIETELNHVLANPLPTNQAGATLSQSYNIQGRIRLTP